MWPTKEKQEARRTRWTVASDWMAQSILTPLPTVSVVYKWREKISVHGILKWPLGDARMLISFSVTPVSLGESGFAIECSSSWPEITSPFPVKLWECDLGHGVNRRPGISNQVFMSPRSLLSPRSYCYPRRKKNLPSLQPELIIAN